LAVEGGDVRQHRPYAHKVVMHCPGPLPASAESIALHLIEDGTFLVAVVGPESKRFERAIDDVAVAHGSPDRNFILTYSYPEGELAEAIEYARWFQDDSGKKPQVVELT
jgi:hypothetical protein